MREGYLPKEQRKNILLLSDDLRMPSGVGVMSKEIVMGTAHRYNWFQIAAALVHPEAGKALDAGESLGESIGVPDAVLRLYPCTGYGTADMVRQLITREKIDGIIHFTDPRYWTWLYQIEHELRQTTPLMFYHVWDDLPFPLYNYNYYNSCDAIFNISKQTHNIVRQVWGGTHPASNNMKKPEPWQIKYIPHGINETAFYRIPDDDENGQLIKSDLRKSLFGEDVVDFVVTYNNRNIRRKMTSDVILAYNEFFQTLSAEQQAKTRLVLHTQPVDENGTDLHAVIRDVTPNIKVVFSPNRLETHQINALYNISNVVINLASNEGFGLGTAEAIMAETMIIANVTGGLQDQMGFVDDEGKYLDPEIHFNDKWGSNHDGKYRIHGEWARPVFPSNRALNGSPMTPYIFDDRCNWSDAAKAIRDVYDMTEEQRRVAGAKGRQFLLEQGMSATQMCNNFIEAIDGTFQHWVPRQRFEVIKG